jgi:transposase
LREEEQKMKRKRRNHSPKFKVKVAVAAMKGDRTLVELAEQFDVHPKLWLGLQAERDMLRQGDPGLRVPVRRFRS